MTATAAYAQTHFSGAVLGDGSVILAGRGGTGARREAPPPFVVEAYDPRAETWTL